MNGSFRQCLAFFLTLSLASCATTTADEPTVTGCRADAATMAFWADIKARAAAVDGNEHALALAQCLSSPDPVLRDQTAYEVLTQWLRAEQLSVDTRRSLFDMLLPWLARGGGAAGGNEAIARAFAALVLSEVMRADSNDRQFDDAELAQMVAAASTMFAAERDYRGLDPDLGWIHAVAHGSDLLWRLARHPGVTADQLDVIVRALTAQVVTARPPPFVFNEADRIGRVAVTVAARSLPDEALFRAWVEDLASPGELGDWNKAFRSVDGMARLHNAKSLLRAVRQFLSPHAGHPLLELVDEKLKELP